MPNRLNRNTTGLLAWFSVVSMLFLCLSSSPTSAAKKSSFSGELVLTGSSTVAPLAAEMAKAFEANHPKAQINVQAGGSARGMADTKKGRADIGMVSRKLVAKEKKKLHAHAIARDGIGLILHQKNSVQKLAKQEVQSVYRGDIQNWKKLGGEDAPFTVVHKSEGRATLEVFLNYFNLENQKVQPHVIIGDNQQAIKTVAGNPHAIGYVSIGAAEVSQKNGVPIRLLGVEGIPATTRKVKKGKYPLARTLNFVTRDKPDGLAKKFIEFAQSSEVHSIVQEQSYVPVSN